MWFRRLFPLVVGLMVGLFDATVSVWFPGVFSSIRFALPFVVALAAFSSPSRALTAAVAAGVVLDAFLPTIGFATFRFVGVVAAVFAASRVYLTNRALVGSLALGAVGFVADRVMRWGVAALGRMGDVQVIPDYSPPFLAEGGWVLLCVAVVFVARAAFARRFVPFASQSHS